MLHFLAVIFVFWFAIEAICYVLSIGAFLLILASGQTVYYTFPQSSMLFFSLPLQKMLCLPSWICGIIAWYINWQAYRKLGVQKIPFIANQKVDFVLDLPYEDVLSLCMDSLENLEKPYKILCSDVKMGIIRLTTPGNNMFSRGMLVVFQITKIGNNQTQILLTSNVRTLITLVDCAKNYKNIQVIVNYFITRKIEMRNFQSKSFTAKEMFINEF